MYVYEGDSTVSVVYLTSSAPSSLAKSISECILIVLIGSLRLNIRKSSLKGRLGISLSSTGWPERLLRLDTDRRVAVAKLGILGGDLLFFLLSLIFSGLQ